MSNETKWTPGPWSSTPSGPEDGYECFWITACPEINQERDVASVCGPQNNRNMANANIIAAAPELYEALSHILAVCSRTNNDVCDLSWYVTKEKAEAALAKARGEEA